MTKTVKKQQGRQQRSGKVKNGMPMINANAAGIDVGANQHYVAVPPDREAQPVRRFGAFTEDLHALAKWLRQCGVTTVAMESTGVYWIPLYQILESYGFTVKLVNARHVKHVPGRKSDVQDCQWLQQLESFGLLTASFRPEDRICVLAELYAATADAHRVWQPARATNAKGPDRDEHQIAARDQ